MEIKYDEVGEQAVFSGEGATALFFTLARLHRQHIAPYAGEAGIGYTFKIGCVAYVLQTLSDGQPLFTATQTTN